MAEKLASQTQVLMPKPEKWPRQEKLWTLPPLLPPEWCTDPSLSLLLFSLPTSPRCSKETASPLLLFLLHDVSFFPISKPSTPIPEHSLPPPCSKGKGNFCIHLSFFQQKSSPPKGRGWKGMSENHGNWLERKSCEWINEWMPNQYRQRAFSDVLS